MDDNFTREGWRRIELSKESSSEALLRGRLADLPRCLREVAGRALPAMTRSGPVIVTGIGGSEGPARMMAELLRQTRGVPASFAPLSAFATGSYRANHSAHAKEETLVIFSQSLSPNARLALACAREFGDAFLFTSAPRDPAVARFEDQGGHVIPLPPSVEQGTLVRIVGPCAAMLAASLHTGAAHAADVDRLLVALREVAALVPTVVARTARVAFVTAGGYGELCRAAKNVWLEALSAPEPSMWDVLEVAHGPFQQFYDSEIVLVALERDGEERLLFDRLERVLVPGRHTLVRLRSSLRPSLAPIDHVAQVIELVCRALAESPRDLGAWLGSGLDAPLYEVGGESMGRRL